ncbi:MAG: L,D-transpeptidase family protein [Paracoccaceae bacterium]|nr:L,D-transpeptidase family protein [Paracoccaceae bacterium]
MNAADLVVTPWGARLLGRAIPVALGRGGIVPPGAKREGDGATPAGVHRITGCLWRAERLARPCGWAEPIGPSDLWSDDVKDEDYNRLVRAPHPFSHERLARPDPLYDVVLLTDWNWPRAEKGRGSAIFVHSWRAPRHPTAGCVAFRRDHLLWIAKQIAPGSRLIVRG